jgi:ABC-2 type transport system permease protein
VVLRNPEFDVTRAIRDVLYRYRSGGELFDQIASPVTLRAYVSDAALLPELLWSRTATRSAPRPRPGGAIRRQVRARVHRARGRRRRRGAAIIEEWGFQPMIAALDDDREFFFYLTLEDGQQVIQLPTGRFDGGGFRRLPEAGLRRFASGFTRSVALALPDSATAPMPGMPPQGHSFAPCSRLLSRDHTMIMEDLGDGSVDAAADLLMVVAPAASTSPRASPSTST